MTEASAMTYVQPSEQFAARIPARGQSTSTSPFLNARLGLNQLGGIFTAVGDWMMRIAETQSRSDRIAALEAKTDAELAAIGIERDQILHHVFRDRFYV
tara:strand:+ start:1362 stop:1658 length:297 start_codon:yes stop_codon:yes gene_type:complete